MSNTFQVEVKYKTRGSILLCHVIARLHPILGVERAWRWCRAVIYHLARYRVGDRGPWLRMESWR